MPSLVIHPRFRRDPNPTFPIGLRGGYNGLEQGITIPIPKSSSALILAGIIDGADQGLKTDDIVAVTRLDTCSRCHWLLTRTVKLPFRCTHYIHDTLFFLAVEIGERVDLRILGHQHWQLEKSSFNTIPMLITEIYEQG